MSKQPLNAVERADAGAGKTKAAQQGNGATMPADGSERDVVASVWRARARAAVAVLLALAGVADVLIGAGVTQGILGWTLVTIGILQCWLAFAIWHKRRIGYQIAMGLGVVIVVGAILIGGSTPQNTLAMFLLWSLIISGLIYSRPTFDR